MDPRGLVNTKMWFDDILFSLYIYIYMITSVNIQDGLENRLGEKKHLRRTTSLPSSNPFQIINTCSFRY